MLTVRYGQQLSTVEIHRSRRAPLKDYNVPLQIKAFFWISSLWWLRWTLDRSQSFCMAATDTPDTQYHRQTCNSAGERAIAVWTTFVERFEKLYFQVKIQVFCGKSLGLAPLSLTETLIEHCVSCGSSAVVHTAIALSPALLQVWR